MSDCDEDRPDIEGCGMEIFPNWQGLGPMGPPPPNTDGQLTLALLEELAAVLQRHGYPPLRDYGPGGAHRFALPPRTHALTTNAPAVAGAAARRWKPRRRIGIPGCGETEGRGEGASADEAELEVAVTDVAGVAWSCRCSGQARQAAEAPSREAGDWFSGRQGLSR